MTTKVIQWTKIEEFTILWPGWECDSAGSLWRSDVGGYGIDSRSDAEEPTETKTTLQTIRYLKDRLWYYEKVTEQTKYILNIVEEQTRKLNT